MSLFNSHIFNTWLKNCKTDMCGCMYILNCSKRWSTNYKCIMHKKENEWETNSSCGFRQKLYCYQLRTTKTVTFSTKHRMFERQVNHKMINIATKHCEPLCSQLECRTQVTAHKKHTTTNQTAQQMERSDDVRAI